MLKCWKRHYRVLFLCDILLSDSWRIQILLVIFVTVDEYRRPYRLTWFSFQVLTWLYASFHCGCADVAWLPTTCLTSISLSRTHLGWSKTVHNLTTDTFFPTLAGYIIPGHLIGSGYSSKIPWSFHDNSGSHRNYIFLGIHKFLMPKTGSRRFVGL